MELETINKLYLELSQVTTAKTNREIVLESALHNLYKETVDYITINNLGPIHHNKTMEDARYALRLPHTYGTRHGVDCRKVRHRPEGGYLHSDDDDTPYDVDGASYCGRCHMAL